MSFRSDGGVAVPGIVLSFSAFIRTRQVRSAAIAGYLAFYPQRVDACFVDDERVDPNEGSFYGGWITSKVVGPFKGGADSAGW